MSIIMDRQKKLISEFQQFSTWEDRYRHLIERGKSLPSINSQYKTDEYKVKGCQSQVWLHAHLNDQGEVMIEGESDALIVSGLVSLLLEAYSGAQPEEILATPPEFLKELGFAQHLSASRTNGLFSMVKQIMYYAQAFKALKAMQQKS